MKPTEEKIQSNTSDLPVYLFKQGNNCEAYRYFGAHLETRVGESGVVFRVWAPHAVAISVVGDFNSWKPGSHPMHKVDGDSVWELFIPGMKEYDVYKYCVTTRAGDLVYKADPYAFHAETRPSNGSKVYDLSGFAWHDATWQAAQKKADVINGPMNIYEMHAGSWKMKEGGKPYNYSELADELIPYIKDMGYTHVELLPVMEYPFDGSWGYQVTGYFAPTSRYGTPKDLMAFVDKLHAAGIGVIMDLVHSHAVKNEAEGLSCLAGDYNQYFYPGERGEHRLWNSRCFDYGKNEVIGFLLSNCKYWLEEFHFDGFRFDGITSMLYWDHGLGRDFTEYKFYYDGNQDEDAITYLTLANKLIHEVNPEVITIAEDMSGMPGLAMPVGEGGLGFDFRMSMGVPDYWIKLIEDKKDEEWHVGDMFYELTNKRPEEHTISYAESHDQAMVGDKTIFFRLVDKDIYTSMSVFDHSLRVDRGMALHKMIRLMTIATAGDGYLNFMGNEFGHPEWIDFPREGNNWSYEHARRLWSLVDDKDLRFRFLNEFDKAMISLAKKDGFFKPIPLPVVRDNERQTLVFRRGAYLFVFNFNPQSSFSDYRFEVEAGKYLPVLDTDNQLFSGFNRIDDGLEHFTLYREGRNWLSLYIPSRTAVVLQLQEENLKMKK